EPGPGEDPYRLHEELQALMQSLVGIFRTEEDLDEAIGRLAELRARWPSIRISGGRAYNPGWGLVYELRNMLIVSEAIARSAKQRHESRGAHSRIDYPEPDEAWAKLNSVVRLEGDAMGVGTTPLPAMPDELRQLVAKE
ncbi:MAG TPA: fumarate reductase/succinate dehydrogenase flavoprotein subunit, partial [Candidatus Bathyarchaeia archaeon]|nr:fumarate reductase/succinate dehydrogenase flavoprotein subunit [Candidatus Bathyarchaeia archaeon]